MAGVPGLPVGARAVMAGPIVAQILRGQIRSLAIGPLRLVSRDTILTPELVSPRQQQTAPGRLRVFGAGPNAGPELNLDRSRTMRRHLGALQDLVTRWRPPGIETRLRAIGSRAAELVGFSSFVAGRRIDAHTAYSVAEAWRETPGAASSWPGAHPARDASMSCSGPPSGSRPTRQPGEHLHGHRSRDRARRFRAARIEVTRFVTGRFEEVRDVRHALGCSCARPSGRRQLRVRRHPEQPHQLLLASSVV